MVFVGGVGMALVYDEKLVVFIVSILLIIEIYIQNYVQICATTKQISYANLPGTVAESVEHGSRVRRLWVRTHGRDKPMTYKIDACRFLPRFSAFYWNV